LDELMALEGVGCNSPALSFCHFPLLDNPENTKHTKAIGPEQKQANIKGDEQTMKQMEDLRLALAVIDDVIYFGNLSADNYDKLDTVRNLLAPGKYTDVAQTRRDAKRFADASNAAMLARCDAEAEAEVKAALHAQLLTNNPMNLADGNWERKES